VSAVREAAEVSRIALQLADLADRIAALPSQAEKADPLRNTTDVVEIAESLYRNRRDRARFFDDSLFGEPSWDILLDLFISSERGVQISISSACQAAAVPTSTALRCIKLLIEKGLVNRVDDSTDGRRSFLVLSDLSRDRMIGLLQRWR
jgi:hypothetical protein